MIERGYFGRALRIVTSDPVTYVAGGLALHALSMVVAGLLVGPAICGIVWITLKHCRGQEVEFADIFRGYDRFGAAFLAGVAFVPMVGAGLVLLLVPGLVLGGLFCFVFPLIADRGLSFGEALSASADLPGAGDLLDRSVFFLMALIVGLSGIVLCVAGLLFTWPLMWAVVGVAYHDITERATASSAAPA